MGAYTDLLVQENDNFAEIDYGCGFSSGPDRILIVMEYIYGDNEDFEDE